MRIIAGDFRGRALASVGKGDQAAHLRPTTDRVRESLFNILGSGRFDDPITDARVLDLFAGTGALGLEAMSRGADQLCCVEMGSKSLSILRKNIEICGVNERTQLKKMDATRLPKCDTEPYSLIFLDPPYKKGLGKGTAKCRAPRLDRTRCPNNLGRRVGCFPTRWVSYSGSTQIWRYAGPVFALRRISWMEFARR